MASAGASNIIQRMAVQQAARQQDLRQGIGSVRSVLRSHKSGLDARTLLRAVHDLRENPEDPPIIRSLTFLKSGILPVMRQSREVKSILTPNGFVWRYRKPTPIVRQLTPREAIMKRVEEQKMADAAWEAELRAGWSSPTLLETDMKKVNFKAAKAKAKAVAPKEGKIVANVEEDKPVKLYGKLSKAAKIKRKYCSRLENMRNVAMRHSTAHLNKRRQKKRMLEMGGRRRVIA